MDPVVLLPPGGQHDDRHVAGFSQLLHRGKTVQLRHHYIHDHNIKLVAAALLQGVHAVLRLPDLVALKGGVFFYKLADFLLVVHDQDMVHPAITFLSVCFPPIDWAPAGAGSPRRQGKYGYMMSTSP